MSGITPLPTPPSTSDPSNFSTRADDFLAALPTFATEANDLAAALNNISTTSTSVTSNTIGTGSKAFTVETGKSYFPGQSVTIARTSDTDNRMFAVVDSYNSGTGALVVTSQAFEGSGTFTDWTITLGFNGVVSAGQLANGAVTKGKLATDVRASEAEYQAGTAVDVFLNPAVARAQQDVIGNAVTLSGSTVNLSTTIPSWVKKFSVPFSGLSTNGTAGWGIQIGDSGGFKTSGYAGSATYIQATPSIANLSASAGIVTAAASVYHGVFEFKLLDASTNTWAFSVLIGLSNTPLNAVISGTVSLSGTLDRVRLIAFSSDVFDAGKANLIY